MLVKDALEKHFQLHMDAVKTHKITPENFMGTEGKIWHETVTAGKVLFANAGTWTWADWIKTYKVPEQQQWDNVGYMLIPAAQKGGKPGHPLAPAGLHGHERQEPGAGVPADRRRHHAGAQLEALGGERPPGDPQEPGEGPDLSEGQVPAVAGYMSEYTTFLPNHPKFGAYDEIPFRLLSAVQAGQMQPKQA